MKRMFTLAALIAALALTGCMTSTHRVGSGGTGQSEASVRQWYALWGLVPVSDADTTTLAGGAADYTVTVQREPIDFVLNIFTGIVTVNSQTVTVKK